MDHRNTIKTIETVTGNQKRAKRVNFVTPVLSVCLAGAFADQRFEADQLEFAEESLGYAENNGLRHLLKLTTTTPNAGMSVGRTYCQIVTLNHSAEVHSCNQTIGGLLQVQLAQCANRKLIAATTGVVGELHDNVVSHAMGRGFSAAQVYSGQHRRIEIAIADIGCGLRGSLRRGGLELDDLAALEWCLKRGNTRVKLPKYATKPVHPLDCPQRLPEDCLISPYPPNVTTTSSDSHHMGEGLYRLTELIRKTGGNVWIWSGNAQILSKGETIQATHVDVNWSGTVIEIEIPIAAFEKSEIANSPSDYEELAQRLGL